MQQRWGLPIVAWPSRLRPSYWDGIALPLVIGAIMLMLWFAVRSVRLIVCILATTITGLVLAAGWGLLVFHRFNVISVAFIPLFVGLGIDFGIQFSVRFRAEQHVKPDIASALLAAGEGMARAPAVVTANHSPPKAVSSSPLAWPAAESSTKR